jgi:hypothetical protein
MKLLIGQELPKAARERGISTDELPRNAMGGVLESALQERFLEVLRDERDERAVENAEALTSFTRKLVRATWAVAIASGALIVTGVVQITVMLRK